MLRRLLRRLAWFVIQRTNDPERPRVVFTHTTCGSQSVIPLGRYFPGWEEPAFECLGCAVLTNQNVSAELVLPEEQKIPTDGSVVVHELY
jgi:hypothetical protein